MHLMLSKKSSGIYATAANSERVDGKVVKTDRIYLGKVVDLEKGIFENKERGIYRFDVEKGEYGSVNLAVLPKKRGKRILEADFGNMYFLIGSWMRWASMDA